MDIAPERVPLTLQLAFPKIFVAGYGASFQFRLLNLGVMPVEHVAITFESEDFEPARISVSLADVAGGGLDEKTVPWRAVRPGNLPLRCRVDAVCDGVPLALEGLWTDMVVHEKPASEVNVTNIIRDVQSHRSSGERAEFGGMKGDVSISVENTFGTIRTLNDLLSTTLPVEYAGVTLKRVHNQLPVGPELRIPPGFLGTAEMASAIVLGSAVLPPAEPDGVGAWRFIAGSADVVVGRSAPEVDVVARFLPATPDNDAKSRGLSRRQARLVVAVDGALEVENISASNVVRAGALNLAPGARGALEPGARVSLGAEPLAWKLGVVRHAPLRRPFVLSNYGEWHGSRATVLAPTGTDEDWGWASFVFPSGASHWQPVWFAAAVSFGSGPDAAVRLPASGLAPVHGFFHHRHGCFWLETVETSPEVWVSGSQDALRRFPVQPGVAIPLKTGMRLGLGRAEFTVGRCR